MPGSRRPRYLSAAVRRDLALRYLSSPRAGYWRREHAVTERNDSFPIVEHYAELESVMARVGQLPESPE